MVWLKSCFRITVIVIFVAGCFDRVKHDPLVEDKSFKILKKQVVSIGGQSLEVEVADDFEKRQKGLMFRTELEPGRGMLFIFEREQPLSFWMKNTYIPLSIAFFDKEKRLINIHNMEPMTSELQTEFPSYKSLRPAKYAVEVPVGWFKKRGIKQGDFLKIQE